MDAIVDALRRERRQQLNAQSGNISSVSPVLEENPLHAASLPNLQTSAQTRAALHDSSHKNGDALPSPSGGSPVGSAGVPLAMGSGDSNKSVSFLVPPDSKRGTSASTDSLPSMYPTSPSPLSQIDQSGRRNEPSASPSVNDANRAVPIPERPAERMDVDPKFDQTEDKKRRTMFNDLFTKHRGSSSSGSVDSGSVDMPFGRPSLAGSSVAWNSSERVIPGAAAR